MLSRDKYLSSLVIEHQKNKYRERKCKACRFTPNTEWSYSWAVFINKVCFHLGMYIQSLVSNVLSQSREIIFIDLNMLSTANEARFDNTDVSSYFLVL